MTLSNFDWTDKDSVKWFILMPSGHEGPYSLSKLTQLIDQNKITDSIEVWAEGLEKPLILEDVLRKTGFIAPELPPIPTDDVPPIPVVPPEDEHIEIKDKAIPLEKKNHKFQVWVFFTVIFLLMFFFISRSVKDSYETFDVSRLPKMSVKLHERIKNENSFSGWDKKIFFKEYLSDDHTHIWLVTTSFHECNVEASFNSIPDKLLSLTDEKVAFSSSGRLSGHIVELSSFDFKHGTKIIPGLYEMDVKATGCEWGSFFSNLMNGFSDPSAEYIARTKVVLFSKGAAEFNSILEKLLKKKQTITLKEQSQNELFWQTLQQKLETLEAVTLQIEQLFLDFLDKPSGEFLSNRNEMINQYTRQYGSFLTTFVVENENYFKNLNSQTKGASQKRNYELIVKLMTKKIGFKSMQFIEEFQLMKQNPDSSKVAAIEAKVKNVFKELKQEITKRLTQVSGDQAQ